ncbi:unnamed protein product [Polarella glacialis]|uniref:Uncharacterized protein n=1 Tax=Polarella glacialis TaxID=89957 RepID=A0A813JUI0_POLGL|nr:unnamed protein product [Polarella glacialis]
MPRPRDDNSDGLVGRRELACQWHGQHEMVSREARCRLRYHGDRSCEWNLLQAQGAAMRWLQQGYMLWNREPFQLPPYGFDGRHRQGGHGSSRTKLLRKRQFPEVEYSNVLLYI